ncbi:MAG: sulfatase-like hydrolase/transferase [Lentisphaerae bacterium]|nr:sulfatase-like hydrolase/transferase [Lentisphaerota bacterium]
MPTNIIHFHAESWDGRMLGMLGHPALRHATPNIDRLAAEGTQFERAYCTHPICCPSRANMWSGRYTHNCESWNNNKGLETGMWCLLDHLPRSHTLKTLGKLDYLTGAHTVMNRVADWLACSGVDKPVFDECYCRTTPWPTTGTSAATPPTGSGWTRPSHSSKGKSPSNGRAMPNPFS